MTDHNHDIITSGIAALADAPDDSDGIVVNGVAIPEGDISEGMSGKRTRWPAKTLREAEGILEGKPITNQLGEKHVGAEQTDSGVRVDPTVPLEAKVGTVAQDRYVEGVGLMWQGEIKDPDMAEKIEQGLAEVSPVVARDIEPADDEAGLFDATAITGARDLGLVSNGALPNNSIEPGESSAVAALSAGAFASTAQPSDEPAESGTDADADADANTDTDNTMSDDNKDNLNDSDRELLAAAGQCDDPMVVESALVDEFEANEALIEAADEVADPVVVDEDEHAALESRTEKLEALMDAHLTDELGLKEGTIEAMGFAAKASEFEDEDGAFSAEALVQTPETGDGGGADGSDGGEPDDEALTRIEEIDTKLDTVGPALPESRVEALHEEAADLADADSYDEALEVL